MEKLVPKLRFPEFSNSWEIKILEKIAKRGTGHTPDKNHTEYYNGGIKWISLADSNKLDNGKIYNTKFNISELGIKKSSAVIHPKNTVLLSRDAGVGKSAIMSESMAVSQHFVTWFGNKNELDNYFLYYKLQILKPVFEKIAVGNTIKTIGMPFFKNLKITIPEYSEQQKIASFLTSVDERLTLLAQQKEKLELYKKGVMQQIFSQKLRFKDENGNSYPDWEEKKLGEILDYEQPTKYLVSDTEYDNKYSTPVVTAGKTFILGYTNEKENIFPKENLPVIIFDDFTTASQFVNFPFKAKSSAMKILHAKEGQNIKFIFEVMQNIKFEVGGHGRHWISKFANLYVDLPCLEEQIKIANVLSSIDAKIDIENELLRKLKEQKKFLLQNLFV